MSESSQTIRVVNLRKERYTLYIGRPGKGQSSKWGNPFKVGPDGPIKEVLKKYRMYVVYTPELFNSLHELDGQILGCFCKPKPCHGDVLVKLRSLQRQKYKGAEILNAFIDEPFGLHWLEPQLLRRLSVRAGELIENSEYDEVPDV